MGAEGLGLVGCHDTWSLGKGARRHIRVHHAKWMQIFDSGFCAAIDVDRSGALRDRDRQAGRQADRQ